MMKLAFFGLYGSFDHHHIGGMDSIARRLAGELVRRGNKVDFVHFGATRQMEELTAGGICVHYHDKFEDALRTLSEQYDHVLTIYVPPKQRLAFARFRQLQGKRTRFHRLYAAWPESWAKRELMFLESYLIPYNGCLFCLSLRQLRHVSKWSDHAVLLLPPVPESYFLSPEEKPKHGRLRVAYMGRIDVEKGALTALALLRYLSKTTEFETYVYGYPWKHKPETIRLHEQLLGQDDIIYEPTEFDAYSPEVDARVHKILSETDVLLLPYHKLSSTIDTPLLLLEGMAHLCAVITRPLGNLPDICGTDQWMLDDLTNHSAVEGLLRELGARLAEERQRLVHQNSQIKFSTCDVVDQFSKALKALDR